MLYEAYKTKIQKYGHSVFLKLPNDVFAKGTEVYVLVHKKKANKIVLFVEVI